MLTSAIVAYVHYASFMLIYAALAVEAVTLRPELTLRAAWQIVIADAVYGLSALLVLVTGILRVLYFGQGTEFYLGNPAFYVKVGIFLVVGTISLYPTFSFLAWTGGLRQGTPPTPAGATVHRLSWIVRAELLGLITMPLFAALMARGIGLGWL